MCGLVGEIRLDGNRPREDALLRARETLARRGPDDGGLWMERGAGLAHRRLAVLDLSPAGHQPMLSACERYVIVFNGEIYNFLELREELAPNGASWKSHSDTEVVLAAYARWGTECLRRFRGMFAFAVWDRQEQRLFAARDRMGVKPFYYGQTSTSLAFASRPGALLQLCEDLPASLDEQALRLYLESGYVPAPFSIYPGVHKLPPAHYLLYDRSGLRIERYWDFRHIEPERSWVRRDEEDLLDELDEIVSQSVKYRLVSDVPLGAFLSGGIDSSLVVAMMAKHSPGRVRTFTIGFDERRYDESDHAAEVARHLGTEHHCEQLRVDDLLELLPVFLREYDEPFFDHSAFPTMAVSRMTRKQVKVSLSGDGGDELFGGYHYYDIAQKLRPLFRLPAAVRQGLAAAVGLVPAHRFKLLAGAIRQPDPAAAFAFSRSIAKDFHDVLPPDVVARTKSLHEFFSETVQEFPRGLGAADQGMRLDAAHTLPDDYLQKVDVASMAFSLESREPLLDHELVEWAMRLPVSWKLRHGRNKYLLRKLAYRYVPESVLDRPKQGFGAPVDDWLRGPLKAWALERIENRGLFERIPVDQRRVRSLFDLHQRGMRNVSPLLWAVLMLLDFADHWLGHRARASGRAAVAGAFLRIQ
jgi:asparagine synthase (glutamine-hydrolysing)